MKRSHLWIPACFALVAGMLSYLAWERGGLYWGLLWPAANCLAVAAAYFGPGGRVFGKRPDGSRPAWVVVWMLPFLTVNYVTWRLQVALSPEDAYNEAAPGLYIGRRQRPGEYPPGIGLVVDLTSEFPKPAYHPQGVSYAALPTLDAFIPEAEDYRRVLALAEGPLLVHCANGHGRAAAFMAALLVRRGLAADVDGGMAMVAAARPACRLNPAQRAAAQRAIS